ncbi:MAG: MFS transporter [Oligosphaeraceae bacterium]
MILNTPLTPEQKRRSQFNYCCFTGINGISYMCLGETVIVLLAVRLAMPDWAVAAISSMIFFGFALLPLGKWMTARVGGAHSQAGFWVARNIVAVGVASSVLWSRMGLHGVAVACVLGGAFLFYGLRAAGVVMSIPLIGEISTKETRGRLIGVSQRLFNAAAAISLVAVSALMYLLDSIWTLFGIILFGAVCGVTASRFLNRIDESENLRQNARHPLMRDLPELFRSSPIRRMILGRICTNLCLLMTTSISLLALKRGYGISDYEALCFYLVMYVTKSLVSTLCSRLSDRISSRGALQVFFLCSASAAPFWILAPQHFCFWHALALFMLLGTGDCGAEIGKAIYFLQCVPRHLQTSASVVVSLLDGALTGLLAIGLNTLLLKGGEALAARSGSPTLANYQGYYWLALPVLILAFAGVSRQRLLSRSRRRRES